MLPPCDTQFRKVKSDPNRWIAILQFCFANTNFGKVVSAVSAAGAMRFFNFGLRFTF
jgi:hypothetical protein